MACTTCKGSCLCGQINISAIKGDKGDPGIDGTNGTDGLPNVLSIGTVTTGTAAAANITGTSPAQVLNLTLPTGTNTYFAWADDSSGTGYTLTPSDKCFMATTDTVVTPGSPIASDFTGKYFRINQPVKTFEDADYINNTQTVIQLPAIITPLTTPCPIIQVPTDFFANTSSFIEYQVSILNNITGAQQQIYLTVAGTEFEIAELQPVNSGVVNVKVKIFYVNSTTIRVVTESITRDIHFSDVTKSITGITVGSLTITPAPLLDIQLTSYRNDNLSGGTFEVIGQDVRAFNPLKTTC